MEQTSAFADALRLTWASIIERMVQFVPSLLAALALLLAGWVLARVLRIIAHRSLALLDRSLVRLVGEERAASIGLGRSGELLGVLVFWSVLLFFLAAATNVLGLDTFADLFARIIDHLPTLLAGLLIVAAGYLLSRLVGDLVLGAAAGLEQTQRTALARTAQWTVLAGALLIGADQMGLRVTFLAIFIGAAAAALVGGVIVAVSLGARTHVANLIGVRQFGQGFEPGQRIRLAGFEGTILEARGGAIVLETPEGRVSIPGSRLSAEPVVLVLAEPSDSDSPTGPGSVHPDG